MTDKRGKHASAEKTRLRDFLLLLIQKHKVCCYFCHKQITEEDIPTRGIDKITEHHLDGSHSNSKIENRELAHRTCHKAYHMKLTKKEQGFWKDFKEE